MAEDLFGHEMGSRTEVETVRLMVFNSQGEILILQKNSKSNAKGLWEFPGGKIDEARGHASSLDEQIQATIRETAQETNLEINDDQLEKVDNFHYSFPLRGKPHHRSVHLFRARIVDGQGVVVNKTLDRRGNPEDKHSGFRWVSPEELFILREENKLSGNSVNFENGLLED